MFVYFSVAGLNLEPCLWGMCSIHTPKPSLPHNLFSFWDSCLHIETLPQGGPEIVILLPQSLKYLGWKAQQLYKKSLNGVTL